MSGPNVWRELAIAGHEGDEATARQGAAGPDPVARQIALGALERMGALTDGDVDVAMGDNDPAVRRRAATLAAKRPAIDLMPALRDIDATVVEAAAWAAGEQAQVREASGESVGEPVLERLIFLAGTAPDPQVREAAVASLGAIGDPRDCPPSSPHARTSRQSSAGRYWPSHPSKVRKSTLPWPRPWRTETGRSARQSRTYSHPLNDPTTCEPIPPGVYWQTCHSSTS